MRRLEVAVTVALATFALGGCATTSDAGPGDASMYGGGDGTSCSQNVVVHARSERAGGRAEYAWIAARYPGYQREMQALMQCNGHPADQLRIRTAEGREIDLFFDISEYFGRM
jgi:hypothetical protein